VTTSKVAAAPAETGRADRSLRSAFLGAMPTWVGSRVAVALVALLVGWTESARAGDVEPWSKLWARWDADLIRKVAEHGYFAYPEKYEDSALEAVFPGMPLLLRFTNFFLDEWTRSGLLITFVAGAVASTCLWRLAADEAGPSAGDRAVLYLVFTPYAVFFFAGYSEMPWLAFAVAAWLAARRDNWWLAGLLGFGAGVMRVNGVLLAIGLVVEYFTAGRARRGGRLFDIDMGALVLPFAGTASYVIWLHSRTGSWRAYQEAQERGWGRTVGPPWEGFTATLREALSPHQFGAAAWSFRAELISITVGAVLLLVLLGMRRWGEAAYVGSSVALLSVSSYYQSTARGLLLLFPLYIVLAKATAGLEWLHRAILWVCAPLMFALVTVFVSGGWAG
jgi:hypothetical protein